MLACVEYLTQGQPLTAQQAHSLLAGDVPGFMAELPNEILLRRTMDSLAAEAAASPPLPPVGRWEYKVVPVSEMGGLATAKGTAGRMESLLNELADDGWELVTTSERDARWMAGETVLLTVRRFVVTEHTFAARLRAEEKVRRAVHRELDAKSALAAEIECVGADADFTTTARTVLERDREILDRLAK